MDVESEQGRNRFELRGNEFNPRLSVGKFGEPPLHYALLALVIILLMLQIVLYAKVEGLASATYEHTNSAHSRWSDVERDIKGEIDRLGEQVITHIDIITK